MKYLNELNDGDAVNMELVIVQKKPPASTKGESLQIVIDVADKTKSMQGRFFGTKEDCAEFHNMIKEGEVYKIIGTFSAKFNSITINKHELKFITNPNWEHLKKEIKPIESQVTELNNYISSIQNVQIKLILEKLFARPGFKEKFSTWPAAVKHHHAKPNGLITHVLEMIKIADYLVTVYPNVNRDLLVCGCILHDFGKIIEYDVEYSTRFSDKGKLLSHISIGAFLLSEIIAKETDCSDELYNQILHMILTHHGKPTEFNGSIMPPKTLEALLLHHIDNLSAQVSPIHDEIGKKEGWNKINNYEYYFPALNKDEK